MDLTTFFQKLCGSHSLACVLCAHDFTELLFSTHSLKSREFFENRWHGHSCSENVFTASGSQMLEKVTELSQTPNFEILKIHEKRQLAGILCLNNFGPDQN